MCHRIFLFHLFVGLKYVTAIVFLGEGAGVVFFNKYKQWVYTCVYMYTYICTYIYIYIYNVGYIKLCMLCKFVGTDKSNDFDHFAK